MCFDNQKKKNEDRQHFTKYKKIHKKEEVVK